MIFDAPHQYSKIFGNWALKDQTHLEQIPNAFSVLNSLPQVSLILRLFTLICRKSISEDDNCIFWSVVFLYRAHDVNFWEKNWLFIFLKNVRLLGFLAHYLKKELVLNKYLLFWNNTRSFTESWQEGNTVFNRKWWNTK